MARRDIQAHLLSKHTGACQRVRGRPKRRFTDALKGGMELAGVREEDAEDRVGQRHSIITDTGVCGTHQKVFLAETAHILVHFPVFLFSQDFKSFFAAPEKPGCLPLMESRLHNHGTRGNFN